MTGATLADAVAAAEDVPGQTVVRGRDNPVFATGGMAVLRGNLAPGSAVIKFGAATPALLQHTGPALVFDGVDDMAARIDDPALDVTPETVLVLRYAGPKGAPGMPEAGYLPIPKKLARAGVKDMVRISDARMSGTAFGTIVLHMVPEAQAGGPLALVRTGDAIRLDVAGRPHRPAGGRGGTGPAPNRVDAPGRPAGRGARLSAALPRKRHPGGRGVRLRLPRLRRDGRRRPADIVERRSKPWYGQAMSSAHEVDYAPVRPPLTARWTEWSALLRPMPAWPREPAPDDATRDAAAAAGPVLVIPGLARGDRQTVRLRRYLTCRGFEARGWGLGVDIGPTRRVLDRLAARLAAMADASGPVNLVGLSMGGLFARWMAHHQPAAVRQVITVCSPFRSPLDSFFLPLRQVAPLWPCDVSAFIEAVGRTPSVPSTCLYTVTDGTVAWGSCLDLDAPADCLEFQGAHVTMAANPFVRSLLADRLARSLPDRGVRHGTATHPSANLRVTHR